MKVGTDAVLLSAWVNTGNIKTALDVGTGSGIISLILAARGVEKIDAIDIDKDSVEEAVNNFNNSPFHNNLSAFNTDFYSFSNSTTNKYDLIISNPPFFINDMKPENEKRKQARHTDTLSYDILIKGTTELMNKTGKLAVVLPYYESRFFIEAAKEQGLNPLRKLLIFPKPCAEPNRVNLELSFEDKEPLIDKFVIRNENGNFTRQYINLLGKYYLTING